MAFHLPGYPKVHNFGTGYTEDLFKGLVAIQEKLDGSQFSFGWDDEGNIQFRSKRVQLYPGQEDSNFGPTIKALIELNEQGKFDHYKNLIFRGEVFRSCKHNTLKYERCPRYHIVIFDIQYRDKVGSNWMHPDNVSVVCSEIGLEYIPYVTGQFSTLEQVQKIADEPSMLGGEREGIVIKNFNHMTKLGDPVFGKYVKAEFREKNNVDFKSRNPTKKDVIENLVEMYKSEIRWDKARQHLADSGDLEYSPRDIPKLLSEVQRDVEEEESLAIKEALFKYFWPQIKRRIIAGLPEWWKAYLVEKQFKGEE